MSRPATSTLHQRVLAVTMVALLAMVAAGCNLRLRAPEGEGPLRYRDEVFTTVTTTSGISYGSAVDQNGTTVDLRLDLYQPAGDDLAHRPAVVWVHGGSFRSGSRTSAEIVDQARVFARKGYVTASISYRLSENGCTSITVECVTAIGHAKYDAQAAVRFVRANAATYGIDPDLIAIAGTSAGAITALNVGYGPDDVGTSGTPGVPSDVRAAVSLSGAKIGPTAELGDAPALLFHGTADTLVPYQWALDTLAAAEGGPHAELTTWEGAGHVPYVAHRQEILDQTTNFLWWNLDLANAPA